MCEMTTDQEIAEALDVALFYKAQCAMLAEALQHISRTDVSSMPDIAWLTLWRNNAKELARTALEQHKKVLKERDE